MACFTVGAFVVGTTQICRTIGVPTVSDSANETNLSSNDPRQPHDYGIVGDVMSHRSRVLNTVAMVVILGFSMAWLVFMSSLPRIEGRMNLAGIDQGATITRDDLGVPHIVAQTRADAYFALGWAHAQERMWQMETQRRVGAGRLAEMVGEAGLASDRYMRTLGLYRAAERSFPRLDAETKIALEAYTVGVNAWLTANSHRLPLEYAILGVSPEPWVPADSLVWQKLMALRLAGNWQDDVLRGRLARRLDPRRLQELFPPYPADAPMTLAGNGGNAVLAELPETARPVQASNMWIVSGSRTDSGKPYLAGDPHLGFAAPILWYLAEIEAPGLYARGATIPGVPFHVIGHNRAIAWSFTASHADTEDLFIEKLAGETGYKTPNGPRPFVTREETIKVKGKPSETLTVRETRHGPVISGLLGGDLAGPGEVVALASTALGEADLGMQALRRLNLALDWSGFMAATKDLQAPVLNIGYADTAGTIGFQTAGRVPVRKSGNGTLPQRGWTGEGDWTGWVPFAKLPQSRNPASGAIVSANNKIGGDASVLITATWPEGYRAQRIQDQLDSQRPATFAAMSRLQGDATSLRAIEIKDLLSGIDFKSPRSREAARMVADWDGRAGRDRPEPLILAAWIERLNHAIFADELGADFAAFGPPKGALLVDVLTRRRHWCDDIATPEPESCEDMIERSLDQAVTELTARWGADMSKWRWGDAHVARFDNPVLGKVPGLRRIADLAVATDGDDFTVSRGSYHAGAADTVFDHVHGAGLRAVFDLADLGNSRFVIATGQGSHPLSRHYADMLAAWRDNRLVWPTTSKSPGALLELLPQAISPRAGGGARSR